MGSFTVTGIDGPNGLQLLAAELAHAAQVAPDEARKIVQKGLLNVKADWRKRWTGHAHAPRLPYSITYDSYLNRQVAGGEVGPDKDKRQGALGNLFEYGSVNNAPIPGGAPAARAEQPRLEKALANLPVTLLGESWR